MWKSMRAGLAIGGIYLPNGNSGGPAGYQYKLDWMDRLNARAAALLAADTPAVLLGDYNVCPTDVDYAPGTLGRQRCAGAARNAGAVPVAAAGLGYHRRGAGGAAGRGGLYVLGLSGRRVAARPWVADRPRHAVTCGGGAAGARSPGAGRNVARRNPVRPRSGHGRTRGSAKRRKASQPGVSPGLRAVLLPVLAARTPVPGHPAAAPQDLTQR